MKKLSLAAISLFFVAHCYATKGSNIIAGHHNGRKQKEAYKALHGKPADIGSAWVIMPTATKHETLDECALSTAIKNHRAAHTSARPAWQQHPTRQPHSTLAPNTEFPELAASANPSPASSRSAWQLPRPRFTATASAPHEQQSARRSTEPAAQPTPVRRVHFAIDNQKIATQEATNSEVTVEMPASILNISADTPRFQFGTLERDENEIVDGPPQINRIFPKPIERPTASTATPADLTNPLGILALQSTLNPAAPVFIPKTNI